MTSPATGRARRPWTQRLLISFNIFIVIAALVCAAGLGYFNMKLSNLKRVSVSGALSSSDSAPSRTQNYLLIGADSDQGLASTDPAVQGRGQVTGMRSDTMMVLRVDPNTSKAQLLSIPRDLWVAIPGTGSHSKVNSAIEIGGPKLAIRTVQQALGIPINHYLEIDFAGFKSLVAAVGGIPIYFNVPVRDAEFCSSGTPGCVDGLLRHSILDIENPGCHVLNPDEALAYARTRYLQFKQNGEWQSDPSADLGRIKRQQDFMRKALKRALSKGLHDPLKLNSLIDAGLRAVTVDDQLSTGDVFSLARKFRSFDPTNLQTIELPTVPRSDGANLDLDPKAAPAVLAPFRGQAPTSSTNVNPGAVRVQVLNGSGQSGQAGRISQGLASVGFQTVGTGDASGGASGSSIIRYAPGQEAQAQLVASYLNGPVTYQPNAAGSSGSIVVVTSSSLDGVRSSPNGNVAKPPAGPTTTASATTAAPAPNSNSGPTSNATGTPTPTTTPGFLPDQVPPGVNCG